MAAVTELSFLLFALSNYIHATERIFKKEGDSYTFKLPENSTSCLISRCVGEEQLVLWNTSDLWSNSSSVPQHLKQRLVSWRTSSYTIDDLTHSDSGRYREECWTEGNVTHDNNFTITVCTSADWSGSPILVRLGETVDLPCEGAADNLDIQWLKQDSRYDDGPWNRVFGDKTTSVMDNVRGRYQVVTNTSALRVSSITTTDFIAYNCLVMNQQQCVSSYIIELRPQGETIYRSVGETAVLPCSIADSTDEQPPRWTKMIRISTDLEQLNQTDPSVDQNYSLVFSSLMLNHSGRYYCYASKTYQHYHLHVCPKFGPPAVELFSEGEEVTLRCRDWGKGEGHVWFIKSNRTEGRIFSVESDQRMSRVSRYRDNGSLVISNISVGDAGEYWCVVYDWYYRCVSTERTVLVWL